MAYCEPCERTTCGRHIALWRKGCFCLSSLRTTYTALFITFDSEVEWCCRKSVQDERCIKVVDYSLVVDVAMDDLPTHLNRALFEAMLGTTWVRPSLESAVVVFFA